MRVTPLDPGLYGRRIGVFDADRCDLVVSDIFMPECDGLEVLKKLRGRSPGAAQVPMSGGSPSIDHDYPAIAGRLGASATLQKPFLPAELLRAVDRALNRPLPGAVA